MSEHLDRRQFLHRTGAAGLVAGAGLTGAGCAGSDRPTLGSAQASNSAGGQKFAYQDGLSPWPICIDTFTIRPASLEEKIRIAHDTGWDGLEIWENELSEFEQEGGNLKDLGNRLRDMGLIVPNVIALWEAFPQSDEEFEQNLPTQRERMRMSQDVGAEHIQVVGLPPRPWQEFDLQRASAMYRRYLEIGLNDYNVNPAVMFLQFMPHIQRMGQASAIALDADHPNAKIIPDVFHLYTGGSGFAGLKHVQPHFIAVFQINDVPDNPPREELEDEHRIYPGDGILPLEQALQDLYANGYENPVTLQLFDETLWEGDLEDVGREGREKTVEVVAKAMGKA